MPSLKYPVLILFGKECIVDENQYEWSPLTGTPCDDGIDCTINGVCGSDGMCSSEVQENYCLIDGVCHTQLEVDSLNTCNVLH